MNKTLKNVLLTPMNVLYRISPKTEIKLMFFLRKGYRLNLSSPVTYSEKLNWMKLYYRDDLIPLCADKYTVRQYVKDCGYAGLLNELLWEGFDANEIPFDELPNQFVAKVTHGSGYNIICKNKGKMNIRRTIKTLNNWLKEKYLPCYGEWFYGIVRPRIIIERFLSEDGENTPVEYKLYYFNNIDGIPGIGCTEVNTGRFVNKTMTMYDANWRMMQDVTYGNDPVGCFKNRPRHYNEMVEAAKNLAKPFLHARIDFFLVKDCLYFSEITFMNDSGYIRISPHEFDVSMGSWIKLPNGNFLDKKCPRYDKDLKLC